MESAIITNYRCNAHCQMCHTWKYPSDPAEELAPEIIDKSPPELRERVAAAKEYAL